MNASLRRRRPTADADAMNHEVSVVPAEVDDDGLILEVSAMVPPLSGDAGAVNGGDGPDEVTACEGECDDPLRIKIANN